MSRHKQRGEKRSLLSRFARFLLFTMVGAFILGSLIHFNWKYSGSGEWQFVHEIDEVRVYSLKEPSEVIKKFKVIGRFRSKLAGIMKVMRDPESCVDVGCVDSYVIDTKDYPKFVYYTFRYEFPEPFKPREFVVLSEFYQNEKTREIYVDFRSSEDVLPEKDCCVRVTHMKNIWRFTPLLNGDVEVEFIMDNHPGGFIPYFLANHEMESTIHRNVPELQSILDKEKYRNAVVDYVKEVSVDEESEQTKEPTAETISLNR